MASQKNNRIRKSLDHRETGKSSRVVAISPLTRFLQQLDDDSDSRLARLALAAAQQPFKVEEYREKLSEKLKHKANGKKTFYVRLARADALDKLLADSTLQEIWNCLLIPRIVRKDIELRQKKLAVTGMPRSFHRKVALDILKHLSKLEETKNKSDIFDSIERERLQRMFREHVGLFLMARRPSGPCVELLGGRRKIRHAGAPTGPDPWNELLATGIAVYWILRTRLPRKLSDRFLDQISILITSECGVIEEENLRREIAEDTLGWRKHLKIPPKN